MNSRPVMEKMRVGSRARTTTTGERWRGSSPSTAAAKAGRGSSRSSGAARSGISANGHDAFADESFGRGEWDIAARKSAYLASVARKFASDGHSGASAMPAAADDDSRSRSSFGITNVRKEGIDRGGNDASTMYRTGRPGEIDRSWLVGESCSIVQMQGPSDGSLGPARFWPSQDSFATDISAAAVSAAFSSSAISADSSVTSPPYRGDAGGLRTSFSRRRSRAFTRVGAAASCTCTKTGLQCTCNESIRPYQAVHEEGGGAAGAMASQTEDAASSRNDPAAPVVWRANHVGTAGGMKEEVAATTAGAPRQMETGRQEIDHWRALAHEIVLKSESGQGSSSKAEGWEADQEENPGELRKEYSHAICPGSACAFVECTHDGWSHASRLGPEARTERTAIPPDPQGQQRRTSWSVPARRVNCPPPLLGNAKAALCRVRVMGH